MARASSSFNSTVPSDSDSPIFLKSTALPLSRKTWFNHQLNVWTHRDEIYGRVLMQLGVLPPYTSYNCPPRSRYAVEHEHDDQAARVPQGQAYLSVITALIRK